MCEILQRKKQSVNNEVCYAIDFVGGFLVHCDQGAEVEEGGVSIVPQDRIPERLLVGSFSHTTRVP